MTTFKKLFISCFILCCCLMFLISALKIGTYLLHGYENKNIVTQLVLKFESTETSLLDSRLQAIKTLATKNSDIIGWISLQDSELDYPLLQTTNNDYYLTHNVYHETSKYGSIFMDYRNQLSLSNPLENLIIYGHNMKDSQMFGQLSSYKNPTFFEEHQTLSLILNEQLYTFEIFSVYETPSTTPYLITKFDSLATKEAYIETAIQSSLHPTTPIVQNTDILLTLSTCSYEFEEARLVIHAKLIS